MAKTLWETINTSHF